MASAFYNFVVKGEDTKTDVKLDKYKGYVVLVVNVASQCGLTESNYEQLKELNDKYHDRGLRIAAFPCNQFGGQEPGCALDVHDFVEKKYKFEPDLYDKVDVNGDGAAPLYKWLKQQQGGTLTDSIKWNFTKFLVDRDGNVVKRFGPTTEPNKLVPDIEKVLDTPAKL